MDQSAQVHERFPRPAEADTILPVHVVVELYLYCLLDGGVYVSGVGTNSVDALEMDPLPEANAVFEFLLCLSLPIGPAASHLLFIQYSCFPSFSSTFVLSFLHTHTHTHVCTH